MHVVHLLVWCQQGVATQNLTEGGVFNAFDFATFAHGYPGQDQLRIPG